MTVTTKPTRSGRRSLCAAAGLSLLAACGSIPTRTLEIRVVDTNEQPVPSLVVIAGQDWNAAAQNKQFVHLNHSSEPLRLPVAFERPEVNLVVAAVPVDDAGAVRQTPRTRPESTELTGLLGSDRPVRLTDPPRLLFVLQRR
ncbi:MAG: hypothetical protein JNL08_03890 [Planctomycetes bacterium]|nr:hypothetical protein [Planctomycetota bacterium]